MDATVPYKAKSLSPLPLKDISIVLCSLLASSFDITALTCRIHANLLCSNSQDGVCFLYFFFILFYEFQGQLQPSPSGFMDADWLSNCNGPYTTDSKFPRSEKSGWTTDQSKFAGKKISIFVLFIRVSSPTARCIRTLKLGAFRDEC